MRTSISVIASCAAMVVGACAKAAFTTPAPLQVPVFAQNPPRMVTTADPSAVRATPAAIPQPAPVGSEPTVEVGEPAAAIAERPVVVAPLTDPRPPAAEPRGRRLSDAPPEEAPLREEIARNLEALPPAQGTREESATTERLAAMPAPATRHRYLPSFEQDEEELPRAPVTRSRRLRDADEASPTPPRRLDDFVAATRRARPVESEGEDTRRERTPRAARAAGEGSVFELTYYDFPVEREGARDTTLYDATCTAIAEVTRSFHDRVCLQGSGKLASGDTVSFARRDCACASTCPGSGQQICFHRLDARSFPHGRGAAGRAITPFKTVAVDPAVVPLGTSLFIPALAGLPRADGSVHDGCFVAEDHGLKVRGNRIDVFTGDHATGAVWRAEIAAKGSARVVTDDPRCPASVTR